MKKLSRGTIWVHCLTVFLILVLVLSSFKIGGLELVGRTEIVKMHLLIGSTVFILIIIQSFLLFKAKQHHYFKTGFKFVRKYWNHYIFYVLLFAITLTGIDILFTGHYLKFLRSENIDDIIKISTLKYHVLMGFFVINLILIQMIGVVKHYIFTKENILKRVI